MTLDPAAADTSTAETLAPEDAVMAELVSVIDPELGVNIVDLGLVYGIAIDDGTVTVTMTMTTPACPLGPYLTEQVESTVRRMGGVETVAVDIVWDPPWEPETMMSDRAKAELGWR